MFASVFVLALATLAVASPRAFKRDFTLTGQTIAFACYGGGGDCDCPEDTFGDGGVLINVWPGFQCAYPSGACTWDDTASHAMFGFNHR
ncbi:hypothetical protein NM688_g6403 [Phlebia brevispora]|uniref:Uncharacterized protein n=1 Tax=Phlebia brevispora TaxID=194682 RepID=A0ACC1SGH7_9APHY|nr:hypothetical protein NM688_g6403 [Phlebia brevispora]